MGKDPLGYIEHHLVSCYTARDFCRYFCAAPAALPGDGMAMVSDHAWTSYRNRPIWKPSTRRSLHLPSSDRLVLASDMDGSRDRCIMALSSGYPGESFQHHSHRPSFLSTCSCQFLER